MEFMNRRESTSGETTGDGETSDTFKGELMRLLNTGHQTVSKYREKLKAKHVVILLGNSKSGKSALINYLMGTNLEAYETELTDLKIRKSDYSSEGPTIGDTSVSETSIPGIYHMQGINHMVISDSPGIDDNRGPERNVINAIFINQLKHARTVKFVMVADINEFRHDNINNFLDALQYIDELLSNCTQIRPSLAFIVTKVPERFSQAGISRVLQSKVLIDEFNLHNYLIKNAARNLDLIGLFKIPTSVGRIGTELDVKIRNAILSCEVIDLERHQITFTLSKEAQLALIEIYPEYVDTNYFKMELNKIIQDFKDFAKDSKENWIFASYDEELVETKIQLETIKLSLEEHQKMSFNQLSDIQTSLETLLGSSLSQEFADNFNFIVILDQSCIVEEQCKEKIKLNYQKLLRQLLKDINPILLDIQKETKTRQDNHIVFSSNTNNTTICKCVILNMIHSPKKIAPAAAVPVVPVAGALISVEVALAASGVAFIATGVGLGCVFYYTFNEIYGKRIQARKDQNRLVYEAFNTAKKNQIMEISNSMSKSP